MLPKAGTDAFVQVDVRGNKESLNPNIVRNHFSMGGCEVPSLRSASGQSTPYLRHSKKELEIEIVAPIEMNPSNKVVIHLNTWTFRELMAGSGSSRKDVYADAWTCQDSGASESSEFPAKNCPEASKK